MFNVFVKFWVLRQSINLIGRVVMKSKPLWILELSLRDGREKVVHYIILIGYSFCVVFFVLYDKLICIGIDFCRVFFLDF